jgi:hypothetical protein
MKKVKWNIDCCATDALKDVASYNKVQRDILKQIEEVQIERRRRNNMFVGMLIFVSITLWAYFSFFT